MSSTNLPKHYSLHHTPLFEGLPVNIEKGPLLVGCLKAMKKTIDYALSDYKQTFAFRLDLRFCSDFDATDSKFISRFESSIKAQIYADEQRRIKAGVRVHRTKVRVIWVKEWGYSSKGLKPHYHLAILLNKQAYRTLGDFKRVSGNMAARCRKACASALNKKLCDVTQLVHFPEKGVYIIGKRSPEDIAQLKAFFFRISYFAKLRQKKYGGEGNMYGASRK
ncbi:inovirus Gp2 family protein [Thalassotalea aquiviva]|uniref:inovirus Gp2 family protein n=1 Tax=Thalassotalea aquiviva TaxID=3242415 RepID=UPI00352B977C